ncbi:ribosomal protein S18 acetylase RimI-like enzyme [Peribacillus deserti]|uniref:Ribosomal protein S18 acetylase RimI-like enzyme n=1 Tax=Peribacillus deserti TaxID=673318 RepID=A0ABS2QD94_9BACI|nr:GNAT family N-acetyltransferase [Peribacillus deserti]MBM7691108.1 ribosomal protein S18 acetylase RimI-like enzyme [Peribacillus deserti]
MYHKEFFVFDGDKPMKAIIRNYTESDFSSLIEIQRECFPLPFPPDLLWNTEQLSNHITHFLDGALCIEIEGTLAGSMTGLLIDLENDDRDHTWAEITDNGYIRTHNPKGNTLYVVDISVRPPYRKLGIGKWLMLSMYDVVIQHGLTRLLGGGRMPGYHKKAEEMSPQAYLEAVIKGKLKDPVITFLLRCGRTPVRVAANYLDDVESCHYGALMEWRNPFKLL